jgi:hypothetical protein
MSTLIAHLDISVEFVEGEPSQLIQSLTLHKAVHTLVTRAMLQTVHRESHDSKLINTT